MLSSPFRASSEIHQLNQGQIKKLLNNDTNRNIESLLRALRILERCFKNSNVSLWVKILQAAVTSNNYNSKKQ